jgi:hypothetical protein
MFHDVLHDLAYLRFDVEPAARSCASLGRTDKPFSRLKASISPLIGHQPT